MAGLGMPGLPWAVPALPLRLEAQGEPLGCGGATRERCCWNASERSVGGVAWRAREGCRPAELDGGRSSVRFAPEVGECVSDGTNHAASSASAGDAIPMPIAANGCDGGESTDGDGEAIGCEASNE